jgi:hypothetical protein
MRVWDVLPYVPVAGATVSLALSVLALLDRGPRFLRSHRAVALALCATGVAVLVSAAVHIRPRLST